MTTPKELAGRQLGDYVLLRKLTSGGMAHIYLGEDKNLGRKAAIKVLTPDMAGADEILKERFEREAKAIANLDHPNIVPIYQFNKVQNENIYFLAMRFVEGNDLADEVKKYRDRGELLPPAIWLPILDQIADALDHAHRRGIIHRDVKPSNILLDETGRAFLSDFGLVLWEEVDKTLGTAFGTPRYISPEQATDSQSAVPQSDIYSLAVIVYELVTGQVMFKGKTPMEVALSHITEQPTPPRAHNPNVPASAQNEIMRALQKDFSKRHPTAAAFIKALREAYDVAAASPSRKGDTGEMEAVSTMPVRPDDSVSAESDRGILDSWDTVPGAVPKDSKAAKGKPEAKSKAVREAPKPKAEVTTAKSKSEQTPPVKVDVERPALEIAHPDKATPRDRKRRRLRPIPLLLAAIAMVAISAAYTQGLLDPIANLFNSIVGGPNIVLRYNDNFFAIKNTTVTDSLLIADMNIVGRANETQGDTFQNPVAAGECVYYYRSTVAPDAIPDDWDCGTTRRITVDSNAFWFADVEQDTEFSVHDGNGRALATCPTFGRLVGRTATQECRVPWPIVKQE